MLTHANILSNVDAAVDAMPFGVGERLLSLLPLSHMMEQTAGLLAPLATGATVYYATSRRSTAIAAALQRHQIGLLVCVPEVLHLLLAGIEREVHRLGRERLWRLLLRVADRLPMASRPLLFSALHRQLGGRFRSVFCGGAALDPDVSRVWEQLGIRVIEGYGATECAPIVTSNRFDRRLPGSVGWPLRGVEVQLGPAGEVLVRGPNVTTGYWLDARATAAAIHDGWYSTGDIGRFGPQHELVLLGRANEMIVLADGRNIFPQDIEDELRREPAIRDCVVVGKPRPGRGEEVHAVIIPAHTPDAAAEAVRRANRRLGPHQQMTGLTIWPEAEFPRTQTLKVKRAEVVAALGVGPVPSRISAPVPMGSSLETQVTAVLARATGRPVSEIRPDADLALDLGLDSLARVELAALLEDEVGRLITDEDMAAQRTVADLLATLQHGTPAGSVPPLPAWPRAAPARVCRAVIQKLVLFPLLRLICRPLDIDGRDRLSERSGPVLFVANHSSHLDAPTILAALPAERRRRTVVAAAADYFFSSAPLATFAFLALGAFPFNRAGAISVSLAHCGDLVDAGYSILIFPEGTRATDGRMSPFKSGIGLLAHELGVPVVPIHLDGLAAILPKGRTWPRPGPVRIRVGEPVQIDPSQSNIHATAVLEQAVRQLKG
jgi:long-chain acyl-CoA synthetase